MQPDHPELLIELFIRARGAHTPQEIHDETGIPLRIVYAAVEGSEYINHRGFTIREETAV